MIVVDRHEPEDIPARLRQLGVPVEVRSIQPGDYVIGEVAVERKTVRDFFASLVRKRLFEQIARLRETYPVPLVLVEGDLAAVAEHANPRAFWGAILALGLDERVPVLFAPDSEQTCQLLLTLHRRAGGRAAEYGLRHKPKALDLEARQRFLVQGLPGIGETLSRNLLERFGSPRAVFTAGTRALAEVPKIGPSKAAEIERVLVAKRGSEQRRLDDE